MKKLLVGSISIAIGNIAGAVLLAIFMFVAAREVSVAEFGWMAALYAVALIVSDLSDFGTGMQLVLRSNSVSPSALDSRVRALMVSRIAIHVTLFVPVAIITLGLGTFEASAVAVLLSGVIALRVLLQARERARRAYFSAAILIVFERSVAVGVLLIIDLGSATDILWCLVIGATSASLVGLRSIRWRRRRASALLQYRASISLGVASVGNSLSQLEVPLVGLSGGAVGAGEYAVAARLLSPVTFLPAALGSVLAKELPRTPALQARRVLTRMLLLSVGSVGLVATGLVISAPFLTEILGDDYAGATLPVQLFALTSVIVAARQIFSVGLQAARDAAYVAKATVMGTITYLILLTLGSLTAGATGATIGALIGQVLLLTMLTMRWLRREGRARG